jgi:hypothetical protein
MRILGLAAAAALCLVIEARVRADDAAEAKAVIEKAITAAGGADQLTKCPAIKRKGKGTVHVDNTDSEINYDSTLEGLHKVRLAIEAEVSGSAIKTVLVYNGDNGWINGGGESSELPKEGLSLFLKEDYRNIRLAELLTPLFGKEYKLTLLGEIKIDDRPAIGVKISQKEHPDFDLFFDKTTGLPVKGQTRVKEMPDAPEVAREYFFVAYKEVEGLQCLTKLKVQRDAKRFLEVEWSEIKPLAKTDPGTFDKP